MSEPSITVTRIRTHLARWYWQVELPETLSAVTVGDKVITEEFAAESVGGWAATKRGARRAARRAAAENTLTGVNR